MVYPCGQLIICCIYKNPAINFEFNFLKNLHSSRLIFIFRVAKLKQLDG